jgi:hypothetical protein
MSEQRRTAKCLHHGGHALLDAFGFPTFRPRLRAATGASPSAHCTTKTLIPADKVIDWKATSGVSLEIQSGISLGQNR